MQNAGLDEAQAAIKIAGRNVNNLRYADDSTLMAESEEELKSLLMKANRWGNNGNSDKLFLRGLQNHCRWWTAVMKLKDTCSLEEKL